MIDELDEEGPRLYGEVLTYLASENWREPSSVWVYQGDPSLTHRYGRITLSIGPRDGHIVPTFKSSRKWSLSQADYDHILWSVHNQFNKRIWMKGPPHD